MDARTDLGFDGYALLTSDAGGRYAFRTVKPGGYPAGPELFRPPHIHFDVTGLTNRLVTQMYFAGEPLNDKDPFFNSAGPGKRRLVTTLQPNQTGLLEGHWDIILDKG